MKQAVRFLRPISCQIGQTQARSCFVRRFCTKSNSTSTVNYSSLSSSINSAFNERLPKTKENIENTSKKFDEIMSQIRGIDVNDESIPKTLVYEICYFMTQYHTTKALNLGNMDPNTHQGSVLDFKSMQNKDLLLAWSLLQRSMTNNSSNSNNENDSNNESSFNSSNIDILKVEIATRLEDSNKLKCAFVELLSKQPYNNNEESKKVETLLNKFSGNCKDENLKKELISYFESLNNDELMIAFTTVPYLGYWSVMNELGIIINNKLESAFDSLYAMALEMPIPDFTAIYDLVSDNELYNKNINIEKEENNFKWQLIDINSIKLKFSNVLCYETQNMIDNNSSDLILNEKKQQELLSGITEDQKNWTNVDISENNSSVMSLQDGGMNNSCLRQMGALISARSFYSYGDMIPVSLYGPRMNDLIHVKGRIEVPIFSDDENKNDKNNNNKSEDGHSHEMPQVVIMHEEEWKVTKEKTNEKGGKMYKGQYIIRQRPMIPKMQSQQQDDDDKMTDDQFSTLEKFAPMDWVYDLEIELK